MLFVPSSGNSNQEAKDAYDEKLTKTEILVKTEENSKLANLYIESDFQKVYYTYFPSLQNQDKNQNQEEEDDIYERSKIKTFLKKKEVKKSEFYGDLICNHFDDWNERKLFASILITESRGKAGAVSEKGATGPWQVMPFWKKVLKIPGSLHNPEVNLKYAKKVLKIHTEEANGELWGHKGGLYRYSGKSKIYAKKISKLMNEIEKV
ncbi:MAG: hypothetical protein ACD_49C00051G0001 [uncultured bacterium (gcode 4)]|uniref:Transglycosylase SLT domain-containing protein n=1 Tax=uncultured bacterium (gcode 4) TaxID=1234023 RepID=K2AWY5_9BACT|nr:MAG: hypothetical protein ACD_49C00051G0001 [uncultured bacterium (gcode 4)]